MERADIKRVLKEMGVADALIEMPAVVEPIYKEMMERTESDLKKQGKVNVDEHGNFSFADRKIQLREDGCAEITFGDAKTTTNSVGIEVKYEDGNSMDWFSYNKRESGKVINTSGNNGNASYYEITNLDNGSWSIKNANGIAIGTVSSHSDEKSDSIDISVDAILAEFDSMSSSVIENYPQTAEWYATKRDEVKALAEKELDPEEQNKRRIEFLESQVEKLEWRNKELSDRLYESTKRLDKAVGFISEVKRSPLGKIFFGKGLKKYEEDSKKLPEGRDDR